MILIGNVILFLLILFIIWWFWLYKPKVFKFPEQGEIEIFIDGGVYTPSLISAKKGSPISLRFIRRDPSKCAEQVIFPDFDIVQTIALTDPQVITITPEKEGEYLFTCDMGMYRGKLIVE